MKDHRRNWVEVRYLSSSDILKCGYRRKINHSCIGKDISRLVIDVNHFSLVSALAGAYIIHFLTANMRLGGHDVRRHQQQRTLNCKLNWKLLRFTYYLLNPISLANLLISRTLLSNSNRSSFIDKNLLSDTLIEINSEIVYILYFTKEYP